MLSLNKKLMYNLKIEYILQKVKIYYATLIFIKVTGYLKCGYKLPYFLAYKTHFFPEKCNLNSNCILYAEGKYLFPNL
jgi:hypothetical protein